MFWRHKFKERKKKLNAVFTAVINLWFSFQVINMKGLFRMPTFGEKRWV